MLSLGSRAESTAREHRPEQRARASSATRRRVRRRDRRDRGVRGPLAPRAVPVQRPRSVRFDEQVLVTWDRLVAGHPHLEYIEIAVSDVPEPDDPRLAVFEPADAGLPARITLYRWALELRASSTQQLRHLVSDVLTEQAASFLAVAPSSLDPGYPRV